MTNLIKDFKTMVESHDLTYQFSDSHQVYMRGTQQREAILRLVAALPTEDVIRIWNENVNNKIREGHREGFYWKKIPTETKKTLQEV